MLDKKDFLRDLVENVYCRIGVSKIHGIGIFAVRDIPAEVNPFIGLNPKAESYEIRISVDEIKLNPDISEEVKKMVDDFYAKENGEYIFPPFGLNEMPISFFSNYSSNPNIALQPNDRFLTLHEIKAGEELTSDYKTFSN